MKSKLGRITSLKEAGYYLLRAFLHCHSQILEYAEGAEESQKQESREGVSKKRKEKGVDAAATTSLIGGIIAELHAVSAPLPPSQNELIKTQKEERNEMGAKYAFAFASVGNCKAYLYSTSTGKITDMTAGNIAIYPDKDDPGIAEFLQQAACINLNTLCRREIGWSFHRS